VTYGSVRVGRYVKVGKSVSVWVDVVFTASAGSIINNLEGLPFTTQNTTYYPTVAVGNFYFIDLNSGGTVLGAYVIQNDTRLRFHSCGNNTNQLSPLTTSSTMEIRMMFTYESTS